jgi:multicomponent K+:H+ antiporter subunit G
MITHLVELLTAVLLLVGAAFALIGSIGLARLPDIFTRLHGPTKATTLGVGGILFGSIFFFSVRDGLSLHELLVSVFLFLTAPVSAHLLARAALHRHCRSEAPIPEEDESGRA